MQAARTDEREQNLMTDAALTVLREHEKGISVKATPRGDGYQNYSLVIQGVDAIHEAEVRAALAAITLNESVTVSKEDSKLMVRCTPPVPLSKTQIAAGEWKANPITKLANMMADAGINYPGSEGFKSKQV